MIDIIAGLIEILKSCTTVRDLIGNKVYGSSLPCEIIEQMPAKCIAIKPAGGEQRAQTSTTIRGRYDIWHYGESEYEAGVLYRIVYDCLKAVEREFVRAAGSAMLIHSISLTEEGMKYIDPDNNWPALINTILVMADERAI